MASLRLRRFRLSVLHLGLLVPWIGLILGVRRPVRDNSYLWHVVAGRVQLQESVVLTTDPFSFTRAGAPWRTQSWLAELLYAKADGWIGLDSVPWILAVVMCATLGAAMIAAWRTTKSLFVVAATGSLTMWAGLIYLNPRPVVFSYLLLALTVLTMVTSRLRWAIPLLIWVWAMVHGSYVIGIGLVVLDAWRRAKWTEGVRWGVGLAFVGSFTAHGWAVWEMLLSFGRARGALDLISEWAPPDLASLGQLPLFIGIVILMVGAVRGKLVLTDLWIIAPMLFLAVSASRSVFPAWLALVPLVSQGFATFGVWNGPFPGRALNVMLAPLLVIGPFLLPADGGLDPARFPVDAAECVDPDRYIFHDDVVGGYLIYARYPAIRVLVDDRAELYGEEMFKETLEIRNGVPGWEASLEAYGVTQVLIRADAAVVDDLERSGWYRQYSDGTWVVYVMDGREQC